LHRLLLEDATWLIAFIIVIVVGLWSGFLGGRITSCLAIPVFIVALWRLDPSPLSLESVVLMYLLSAYHVVALIHFQLKQSNPPKSVDATARSPVVEPESTAPTHHL